MTATKPHTPPVRAAEPQAPLHVVIENVTPEIDVGRCVGARLTVRVDVHADGHGELVAMRRMSAKRRAPTPPAEPTRGERR